jgi:hypothetical protein
MHYLDELGFYKGWAHTCILRGVALYMRRLAAAVVEAEYIGICLFFLQIEN